MFVHPLSACGATDFVRAGLAMSSLCRGLDAVRFAVTCNAVVVVPAAIMVAVRHGVLQACSQNFY